MTDPHTLFSDDYAASADAADPLQRFRAQFHMPRFGDDGSVKGNAPFTDAVVARLPLAR